MPLPARTECALGYDEQSSRKQVSFAAPVTALASRCSPLRGSSPSPRASTGAHDKGRRFESPLRQEAEREVLNTLSEAIQLERRLEKSKQDIVLRPDFNTFDVFRMFDEKSDGAITIVDFQRGLRDLVINYTESDSELFFRRYDRNRDGRLSFSEFVAALTPDDPYTSGLLGKRLSSY